MYRRINNIVSVHGGYHDSGQPTRRASLPSTLTGIIDGGSDGLAAAHAQGTMLHDRLW